MKRDELKATITAAIDGHVTKGRAFPPWHIISEAVLATIEAQGMAIVPVKMPQSFKDRYDDWRDERTWDLAIETGRI